MFAARARSARRRARRPLVLALAAVLTTVLLGVLMYSGPLLVVRDVEVTGGPPLSRAQIAEVREVAQPPIGRQLAQVDTSGIQARVAALPFVAGVDVSRGWPSTLRIAVRPRVVVAAVPAANGGFALVDGEGVSFAQAAKAPTGVPVVHVDLDAAGSRSLTAALSVLEQLPPDIASSVRQVRATSPDAVRLRIGSADVVWGSADRTVRKAEIFRALRSVRAKVYDVSSPDTPVTR